MSSPRSIGGMNSREGTRVVLREITASLHNSPPMQSARRKSGNESSAKQAEHEVKVRFAREFADVGSITYSAPESLSSASSFHSLSSTLSTKSSSGICPDSVPLSPNDSANLSYANNSIAGLDDLILGCAEIKLGGEDEQSFTAFETSRDLSQDQTFASATDEQPNDLIDDEESLPLDPINATQIVGDLSTTQTFEGTRTFDRLSDAQERPILGTICIRDSFSVGRESKGRRSSHAEDSEFSLRENNAAFHTCHSEITLDPPERENLNSTVSLSSTEVSKETSSSSLNPSNFSESPSLILPTLSLIENVECPTLPSITVSTLNESSEIRQIDESQSAQEVIRSSSPVNSGANITVDLSCAESSDEPRDEEKVAGTLNETREIIPEVLQVNSDPIGEGHSLNSTAPVYQGENRGSLNETREVPELSDLESKLNSLRENSESRCESGKLEGFLEGPGNLPTLELNKNVEATRNLLGTTLELNKSVEATENLLGTTLELNKSVEATENHLGTTLELNKSAELSRNLLGTTLELNKSVESIKTHLGTTLELNKSAELSRNLLGTTLELNKSVESIKTHLGTTLELNKSVESTKTHLGTTLELNKSAELSKSLPERSVESNKSVELSRNRSTTLDKSECDKKEAFPEVIIKESPEVKERQLKPEALNKTVEIEPEDNPDQKDQSDDKLDTTLTIQDASLTLETAPEIEQYTDFRPPRQSTTLVLPRQELNFDDLKSSGEDFDAANEIFKSTLEFPEDSDNFVSATSELFHDPAGFDFLLAHGNSKTINRLRAESLYVKFDPLVGDTSMLPQSNSQTINEEQNGKNESAVPASVGTPKRNAAIAAIDRLLFYSPIPSGALQKTEESKEKLSTEESKDGVLIADVNMSKELELVRATVLQLEEELEKQRKEYEGEMERQKTGYQEKINKLQAQIAQEMNSKSQMTVVVEEYEKSISRLHTQREKDRTSFEQERAKLQEELHAAQEHLTNTEAAFNDVHQKYERLKGVVAAYKSNETVLKESIQENLETIKGLEVRYDQLKEHAMAQLEKANLELEANRKQHEDETVKLHALLRKAELQSNSLAERVEQKTKENKELTQILDEVIARVGHQNPE